MFFPVFFSGLAINIKKWTLPSDFQLFRICQDWNWSGPNSYVASPLPSSILDWPEQHHNSFRCRRWCSLFFYSTQVSMMRRLLDVYTYINIYVYIPYDSMIIDLYMLITFHCTLHGTRLIHLWPMLHSRCMFIMNFLGLDQLSTFFLSFTGRSLPRVSSDTVVTIHSVSKRPVQWCFETTSWKDCSVCCDNIPVDDVNIWAFPLVPMLRCIL